MSLPITISLKLYNAIVFATLGLSTVVAIIAWIMAEEGIMAAIKTFCISIIAIQLVLWLIVPWLAKRCSDNNN